MVVFSAILSSLLGALSPMLEIIVGFALGFASLKKKKNTGFVSIKNYHTH